LLARFALAKVLLQNQAGARLWIDAIFFRVSAMLSGSKTMVLNIGQHLPAVGISVPGQRLSLKILGTIDYAALTTEPSKHGASDLSVDVIERRLSQSRSSKAPIFNMSSDKTQTHCS
jgi:hypothetical protein